MKIVIDTREQSPYLFRCYDTETVRHSLPSGDYSLANAESLVAVERKELSDLVKCLTFDRPRFFRELNRLRTYESAALVIEAPLRKIERGGYRSQVAPNAVVQSLIAIQAQYRLPVFFADDRQRAEEYVYHFLRHYENMAARKEEPPKSAEP